MNKKYYKNIKRCRSCKSKRLIKVISLGPTNLPDYSGKRQNIKIPLDLVLCKNCKLLQLKQTTNPHLLWNDNYGYQSGMNKSMTEEIKDIVKEIERIIKLKSGDIVLDIGCNDGTLLDFYKARNIHRFGFDPSGNVLKIAKEKLKKYGAKNTTLVKDFFSKEPFLKSAKQKAKVITAIAMFYDIDDPNKFIRDVYECLDKNGILVIQQNYLVKMIKNNAIDNIVHEHLNYYSFSSLKYILDKNSLETFDIQFNDINGGSFRTFIRKKDSRIDHKKDRIEHVENIIKKEEKLLKTRTYKKFASRTSKNLKKLKNFLEKEREKGKKIYIYGASTRGNTIISFLKLDNTLIGAAVDKNPFKWGKKISNTNIPIISEEQARKEKPDYFLALPWYFKNEFIEREKDFIKRGGKFIFPLPKMEIFPN